jgi:two-component system cell cycle response regulator
MQGTILIIDGVSTNRIMLKVQLSAAWYHVVQADRLTGLAALARRVRPDLVLTAMALPDGDAVAVRAALAADPALASVPVIAVTAQNDRAGRLRALAGGVDDVLAQPIDDGLLQARVRSLIRAEAEARDLATAAPGFAEALTGFTVPAVATRVALLTADAATGPLWRARLAPLVPHQLRVGPLRDAQALIADAAPDAMVVDMTGPADGGGLRLLADLRAHAATRHAAVIAITAAGDPRRAAEALDRGADDVMTDGFGAEELALRLRRQLDRKTGRDRARDSLRDGLKASLTDHLTGLYNRRYALPHLACTAQAAADTGEGLAVMLADLDHFKRINDCHGHIAGDAVLVEASRRMRAVLGTSGIIARIGGEEFLIVLPGASAADATRTAARLCRCIDGAGFAIPGQAATVPVSISIGVVVVAPGSSRSEQGPSELMAQADRALYRAKGQGRNRISLIRSAAA